MRCVIVGGEQGDIQLSFWSFAGAQLQIEKVLPTDRFCKCLESVDLRRWMWNPWHASRQSPEEGRSYGGRGCTRKNGSNVRIVEWVVKVPSQNLSPSTADLARSFLCLNSLFRHYFRSLLELQML